MKTYLFFFGKSQDFTFEVFDEFGKVNDFNKIIKDFDLLESEYFNIDDINNTSIIAKYNFVSNAGVKFSMLKLYSLAQAVSGNRIEGSIYGVALLSERDLSFSETNLSLLKQAKDEFAKLSLAGLKFNKSNFSEDANAIWNAIVNSEAGNYFRLLSYGQNIQISNNRLPRAYFVNSIFDTSHNFDNQMGLTQRLYVSNDIDHLKRMQLKWGNSFPVFIKSSAGWESSKPKSSTEDRITRESLPPESSDMKSLKIQLSDLQYEYSQLELEAKEKIKNHKSKTKLFKFIIIFQLLILAGVLIFSILKKNTDNKYSEFNNVELNGNIINNDSVTLSNEYGNKSFFIDEDGKYEALKKIIINIEKLRSLKSTKNFKSDSVLLLSLKNNIIIAADKINMDTSLVNKFYLQAQKRIAK
jgi:hypothetical protein